LALLVAIGAALGLLQQRLFWLLFSYAALVSALLVAVVVARRRGRSLSAAQEERKFLTEEIDDRTAELKRSDVSLALAREEAEGCEAGYADLRDAVINAARLTPGRYDGFDGELANALHRLSSTSQGA
jgi:C4-dicarboxylate-specific signal transduction histidine kinase